mmetsp:Transcript_5666/g.13758  ORF Transcript_5666/g.13758 Transcript_5666/m.13758 type:complete len:233 (-) Transcript_5666:986-1684(-)
MSMPTRFSPCPRRRGRRHPPAVPLPRDLDVHLCIARSPGVARGRRTRRTRRMRPTLSPARTRAAPGYPARLGARSPPPARWLRAPARSSCRKQPAPRGWSAALRRGWCTRPCGPAPPRVGPASGPRPPPALRAVRPRPPLECWRQPSSARRLSPRRSHPGGTRAGTCCRGAPPRASAGRVGGPRGRGLGSPSTRWRRCWTRSTRQKPACGPGAPRARCRSQHRPLILAYSQT